MWITTSPALLLGSFSAIAPPPGPQQVAPAAPDTPDQLKAKFLALEDEFDEARQAFRKEIQAKWEAHQKAGGTGETFEYPEPFEAAFFPRFLKLADGGSPNANAWCLMHYQFSEAKGTDAKKDKTHRVLQAISGSPSKELLQGICGFLGGEAFPSPWGGPDDPEARLGAEAAFAFLDVIRASTDDDDVKASTLYTRASALKDSVMRDRSAEGDKVRAEADIWFEKVATQYPDTQVGQRCVGKLFASRNLKIGQVAPDIVGKDHDGNDIRRSDFEGKVTVLDFWGFW